MEIVFGFARTDLGAIVVAKNINERSIAPAKKSLVDFMEFLQVMGNDIHIVISLSGLLLNKKERTYFHFGKHVLESS